MALWPSTARSDLDGSCSGSAPPTRGGCIGKRGTTGCGAVYQSRFKAVPVHTETYFYRVLRYIERNAARADLCERADDWPGRARPLRAGALASRSPNGRSRDRRTGSTSSTTPNQWPTSISFGRRRRAASPSARSVSMAQIARSWTDGAGSTSRSAGGATSPSADREFLRVARSMLRARSEHVTQGRRASGRPWRGGTRDARGGPGSGASSPSCRGRAVPTGAPRRGAAPARGTRRSGPRAPRRSTAPSPA